MGILQTSSKRFLRAVIVLIVVFVTFSENMEKKRKPLKNSGLGFIFHILVSLKNAYCVS